MSRERALDPVDMGRVTHEYSKDEAAALKEQWLAVFGTNGFGSSSRKYLWHVFGAHGYPAVEGADALASYESHSCDEYLVLANDRAIAYRTDTRPTFPRFSDWYVFPLNLAWTMAFTHEEGWIGPFFAKHPDYERMNVDNLARIKKLQDIAEACNCGWA